MKLMMMIYMYLHSMFLMTIYLISTVLMLLKNIIFKHKVKFYRTNLFIQNKKIKKYLINF